MALISCKECKKEVSSAAQSCPHCGCPLPSLNETDLQIIEAGLTFAKGRIVAGLVFWPALIWLLIPVFSGGDAAEFTSRWALSRWFLGFGALWYILSEIERNLYVRKLQKAETNKQGKKS